MIINYILNLAVAAVCVWAVLTPKLKTTSLEIMGLFIIFIGSILNINAFIQFGSIDFKEVVVSVGVLFYGLFVCIRLTITPFILNVKRKLIILKKRRYRCASKEREKQNVINSYK